MMVSDGRLESWFLWFLTMLSGWLPVAYLAVMAGLAIWVVRNRPVPGAKWLAFGFATNFVTNFMQGIAYAIAFPDYMVEGEMGQEFPRWVTIVSDVSALGHYVNYFIIAFGFWKLCEHLVRGPVPVAQSHGD